MEKIIEIPKGYEARIEGNKVILESRDEDERIRKALVDLVYSDVNELIGGVEKRLCVSWLEKQKIPEGSPTPDLTTMLVPNRYNEQKPAEWSEEDEKILNELLDYCNTANAQWYNWLENRLKSLRPRPHWKPSEEQMEALSFVKEYLKYEPLAKKEYICLVSLDDDLKKL